MWVLKAFARDILDEWKYYLYDCWIGYDWDRSVLGSRHADPDKDDVDYWYAEEQLSIFIAEFFEDMASNNYYNEDFHHLDLFSLIKYCDPDATKFHIGRVTKSYCCSNHDKYFNSIDLPIPSESEHKYDPDIEKNLEKAILARPVKMGEMKMVDLLMEFDRDQLVALFLGMSDDEIDVKVRYSDLLEVSRWNKTD